MRVTVKEDTDKAWTEQEILLLLEVCILGLVGLLHCSSCSASRAAVCPHQGLL